MLRGLQVTPTSADPLVATLFALNCRRFGKALFLACEYNAVERFIGTPNCLAEMEKEVVVDVAPLVFAERFAEWVLDPEVPHRILTAMGFDLPAYIDDRRTLIEWIFSSPRLSDDQTSEFDQRILQELSQ